MTVLFSPFGNAQYFDTNGDPAVGYTVTTYAAGSSTLLATYTDSGGLSANANPVTLNAAGLNPNGQFWLTSGLSYKFVVKDAGGVTVQTVDGVTGVNDPATLSTTDEWVAFAGTPTYISAVSFSLAGDQTSRFNLVRRLKTSNTGGTVYSRISGSSFGAGITTVTVVNDSGTLDAGLSAVSYGLLSATNPSIPESANGKLVRTGSVPAFSYGQTVSQNLTSGAPAAKITFTTQDFDDTGGMFASSRFTPTVAGRYLITAAVYLQGTTLTGYDIYVYKNGALYKRGATAANLAGAAWQAEMGVLVSMNGSTDYIEIFADATGTGTISTNAIVSLTYFQGVLVRAA